jgi:hypothetical protein
MTDPHRLWLRPIKVLEEREAVRRPDANGEVSAPGRKRPGAQLGTEGAKGVLGGLDGRDSGARDMGRRRIGSTRGGHGRQWH